MIFYALTSNGNEPLFACLCSVCICVIHIRFNHIRLIHIYGVSHMHLSNVALVTLRKKFIDKICASSKTKKNYRTNFLTWINFEHQSCWNNTGKMASSSGRLTTKHQQNISMLLEKLKEFSMDAETISDGRIYGRIVG